MNRDIVWVVWQRDATQGVYTSAWLALARVDEILDGLGIGWEHAFINHWPQGMMKVTVDGNCPNFTVEPVALETEEDNDLVGNPNDLGDLDSPIGGINWRLN